MEPGKAIEPLWSRLVIKPPGILGHLSANLATRLVEISGTGMSAYVRKALKFDQEISIHVTVGEFRETFNVTGRIRSVTSAPSGHFRVDIEFVKPPVPLRMCIRSMKFLPGLVSA